MLTRLSVRFVLAEGTGTWDGSTIINGNNPQRRDVQIVQANGYAVRPKQRPYWERTPLFRGKIADAFRNRSSNGIPTIRACGLFTVTVGLTARSGHVPS